MKYITLFFITVSFLGCTKKETVEVPAEVPIGESWINLIVITQAGKYLEDSESNHFPLPFNLCQLSGADEKVILIAETLPEGSKVKAIPIGFIEFGTKRNERIIVSVPFEEDIKGPRIQNFREFLFDYEPLKGMLENWLVYNEFPGKFSHFQWQDESTAMKWLKEKYL